MATCCLRAEGKRASIENYDIGKQELVDGRPALREGPYARVLVERGMAALAIDLPCFSGESN